MHMNEILSSTGIYSTEITLAPEKTSVIDTLRIYPIAKRPSYEIEADITAGKKPNEISYNSVVFVLESCPISADTYVNPSSGQLRPLLERLEPNEDIYHGARRIVEKQTPFTLSEFPQSINSSEGIWVAPQTFAYNISSLPDSETRSTTVTALEINRSDTVLTNSILPEKYKDAKLIYLSTEETLTMIEGEQYFNVLLELQARNQLRE